VNTSPTFGSEPFAHGQCHVASSANAQWTIWTGFQRASQTVARGALITVDTVSRVIKKRLEKDKNKLFTYTHGNRELGMRLVVHIEIISIAARELGSRHCIDTVPSSKYILR
jgi:hypothetical protein